jgi:hypothetical protein
MTNLQLQLICSIVIPKQYHIFMKESESYCDMMIHKYEKQIQSFIDQMENNE